MGWDGVYKKGSRRAGAHPDASNSSSMSSNLLLLSSLAFIQPLRGLPSPMGSNAPWYSDYDIEEYIYSDYYDDYYGDYNGEEVKEVAELCFPDELNHQAIHLLRPLMGFLATMEQTEEDTDMQQMTASIMEQAANFGLVGTRFLLEGKLVSEHEGDGVVGDDEGDGGDEGDGEDVLRL